MDTSHQLPSALLERAVNEISRLPGLGRKTALRLALHMLRRPADEALALSDAVAQMRSNIRYCRVCHNISDCDVCEICSSAHRDHSAVCVVENVNDVMALERTGQFCGLYHVLGGLISPMDGIGPDLLQIDSLVQRVASGDVKEVILALSATPEGDTTNFYLYRRLGEIPQLRITQLARGVAVGSELEYTDELTLGRSIVQRTLFSDSFGK